jgi:hypothetical protein
MPCRERNVNRKQWVGQIYGATRHNVISRLSATRYGPVLRFCGDAAVCWFARNGKTNEKY